ncbi:CHAT domain-containing protein [Rubrobacter indicoceani]|uniref:CHAT domain-containing protein n=1 Tax=Rubrobacter indicoceani TaxID=2051957 RepID=UPI000E5B699C|nr:CHAT domain-containing tetratricopeptide repeat protein [Rubrobacter indicoceani]
MSYEAETEASLTDEVLGLPTRDRREELLHSRGLLNAEGLDRLLDEADDLLGSDPGRARRLAKACLDLAETAKAPAAVPKASYVLAGVHNINGEFEEDLRLTQAAHDRYVMLGMHAEALRTNVGKMAALLELGRYQKALDVGRSVLDTLDGKGELDVRPTKEQADLLTALVQQNRGGCYEYMGHYDEALSDYASAEEHYRELGMVERLGEIADNRGAILSSLGRSREALAAHEDAADVFSESELTLPYTKALVNVGEAHLRLGNYRASLEAFEKARPLLESLGSPSDGYLFLRHTADAYLELNLYTEALASYREAEVLLKDAGMAHDRAQALWGMGTALVARSEFGEAGRSLREAAALFSAAGNAPMLSGVMLEQAALLMALGETAAARKMAEDALSLIVGESLPVQEAYAHLRLVDLFLPDDPERAEHHLDEALLSSEGISLPQLGHRLRERLGRLRRLQGREAEAEVALREAMDEIERLRGFVDRDAARASFLQDKTAAYEELLQLYLGRPDDGVAASLAFEVSERAKSRALVDLLTGVVEVGSSLSEAKPGGRLAAAHADLNAVYNEMLGGSRGGAGRFGAVSDLNRRASELEEEIGRLRLREVSSGTDPFSVPTKDTQDHIPPDVTVLAYHIVGDEIFAFCRSGDRLTVIRNVGSVAEVRGLLRKLEAQWDRFRAGTEFSGRHGEMLERSARRVLAALYDELLRPLKGLLPGASDSGDELPKLAIIPHGELHQVPFHALFDGEEYAIELYEFSYAPSVTVFALCQKREPRPPENILAIGVEDPTIPSARLEARSVARGFPESSVLTGDAATLGALDSASGFGVVHLACHGLFRSDNPMFSSLKLDDGWLLAADAMNLDLSGATVTLSACESGRSRVAGGDETLGLTRAFLGAGASTLLVSLWLVQDDTTAGFMESFYADLLEGSSPAPALNRACRETKKQHPHPYHWAAFLLVGRR